MTARGSVASRIESAIRDLDEAMRLIRQSIFGLRQTSRGDGLRQGILDLCGELAQAAAAGVTFSGPVDDAVPPRTGQQLLQLLGEALVVIGGWAWPARVEVMAGDGVRLTVEGTRLAAGQGGHAAQPGGIRRARRRLCQAARDGRPSRRGARHRGDSRRYPFCLAAAGELVIVLARPVTKACPHRARRQQRCPRAGCARLVVRHQSVLGENGHPGGHDRLIHRVRRVVTGFEAPYRASDPSVIRSGARRPVRPAAYSRQPAGVHAAGSIGRPAASASRCVQVLGTTCRRS